MQLNLCQPCVLTEQWKELSAGEPGWSGLLAPGLRDSHKTTPRVAAHQCCPSGGEAED